MGKEVGEKLLRGLDCVGGTCLCEQISTLVSGRYLFVNNERRNEYEPN